jgi:hypothetical protein
MRSGSPAPSTPAHVHTPLPSRLVEVVTERIDWQLVAPYGYAPMLA